MTANAGYPLYELCQRAGVTPRTVRYYIQQGLLAPPGSSGPKVRYPLTYVARLKLIRWLQDVHRLSLGEIREQLDGMDAAQIQELVESDVSPATDSAADYIRRVTPLKPSSKPAATPVPITYTPDPQFPKSAQWKRITLHPDVEIQIRQPVSRKIQRRVQRLIEMAHKLFDLEIRP
jgi:DNA-binding transcriptional MerR regulator